MRRVDLHAVNRFVDRLMLVSFIVLGVAVLWAILHTALS